MESYNYQRPVQDVDDQWHKIILPDDLYVHAKNDLSDLRLFGVKEDGTVIEAPYLLRGLAETTVSAPVSFNLINQSNNSEGYFYTFEVPTANPINQIELNFSTSNFDLRLKLEGSQDQKEWFTLIDDYRILSINNDQTNFKMTEVNFPEAKYQFFRLKVLSSKDPGFSSANIQFQKKVKGSYQEFPIQKFTTTENKTKKQTELNISLAHHLPISKLQVNVDQSYDYYRKISIKYLRDSTKLADGWKYNYKQLASGTLSSIHSNTFKFSLTTARHLKVIIYNQDNSPLSIESVKAQGYQTELQARFTEPATYYLTYGNSKANPPDYDINRFTDNIPKELTILELGSEKTIPKTATETTEPLFKNKAWLWGIMIVIIGLLGWFSLRMIQDKK